MRKHEETTSAYAFYTIKQTKYQQHMSSKNKKLDLNRDVLYDLYIGQRMTTKEIGKIFDCSSKCIRNYLAKFGIPIRQNGEAVKLERSK